MAEEAKKTESSGGKLALLTRFIDSGMAELGGAAVTIGSGIAMGVQTIRNRFFSNANKKFGVFDGVIPTIPTEGPDPRINYVPITDPLFWKVKDTSSYEKIIDQKKAMEVVYEETKSSILKSKKLTGLHTQWNMLLNHQKIEVGLSVATVFAVGIGAILALAGTRHVSEEQKHLQKRLKELDDAPQR
jgi:hypothetical protein